ncbi:hypothetical protein [Rheinheimera sp.]|uniref:hypothetical protein n=1 Tax=Rheinheimera sp. TaxID=1869214 RepID=UPI003AF826DF
MPHSHLPHNNQFQTMDELTLHEVQRKLLEIQQFIQQLAGQPELVMALQPAQADSVPTTAADPLLQHAKQGNAQAQYQLGLAYLKGQDRPLSLCHATCWFHLAALKHHADAERALTALQLRLNAAQWQQAQYLAAERLEQNTK